MFLVQQAKAEIGMHAEEQDIPAGERWLSGGGPFRAFCIKLI